MIHTSGSVDINVFQSITENRGVLYPFQTFTKNIDLSFEKIPLCLEAGNQITKEKIEQLAKILSDNYHFISLSLIHIYHHKYRGQTVSIQRLSVL